MTAGERRRDRLRRLLDRLAEILRNTTRPEALSDLIRAVKAEETQKGNIH